jgi:hypothetical protein
MDPKADLAKYALDELLGKVLRVGSVTSAMASR